MFWLFVILKAQNWSPSFKGKGFSVVLVFLSLIVLVIVFTIGNQVNDVGRNLYIAIVSRFKSGNALQMDLFKCPNNDRVLVWMKCYVM